MVSFLSFVFILGSLHCANAGGLEVVFEWKYLDWIRPVILFTGREFKWGNPFTQDVDVDRYGRIFVTSPQWLDGVPISLSLVAPVQGRGGPLLTPYPSYIWHKENDCKGIISVYRMAIDECNRMWIVDIGRSGSTIVCPAKILIFDLETNQLIHKYIIPDDQVLYGKAAFVTPIVEVGETCLDTYLYVADVDQNGLLIYDLYRGYSWRVNNTRGNAFGPDDDAMNITIAGESFDLTDGTLGMSLSPPGFFKERYLYFNSLASYLQKFTSTTSLKLSQHIEPIVYESNYKRASQAGVQATSRTGAIFFQLVQLTAIACWNIEKPFAPENIVMIAQDEEKLQYVSGIKVIVNDRGEEELWINTNRLQKTINKTMNTTETNFRLIKGNVYDLIRGTNCERTGGVNYTPDTEFWHRI